MNKEIQLTQKMNQLLKDGKVKITKPGLLSQDFETTDKVIVVKGKRIGGGFGVGTTYYIITQNGVTKGITLMDAYKTIVTYLEEGKK